MTKLEKANNYIKENMEKVNSKPTYHFTPEIGWLNDPNGFSYYKGKYHLFYQFYPYDVKWNDMHWGHATSKDLVTWEYEKVAMANDTLADANGCFSGSAIEKDEMLYLMYTGMLNPNMGFEFNPNEVIQHQCLAYSEDGINFKKHENNPIISQYDLPDGYKRSDFRDPKVIEKNGIYYVILVAKNNEGRGDMLLYKSLDLIKWDYVSAIYKSKYEENMMFECPDLFTLDGKDVIIFSGMPCDEKFDEEVGNTTEYIVGTLDYEKGIFNVEKRDILDYGHSFYAPQSMEDSNQKRITIGWMKKWINKKIISPEEFGWNGIMSIPRELKLDNLSIIQKPIESLSYYFYDLKTYRDLAISNKRNLHDVYGTSFYLKLNVLAQSDDIFTVNLFEIANKSIKLVFNFAENVVTYDSSYEELVEIYDMKDYELNKKELLIEIYADMYSVEVFLNSGEKAFSFTSFADKGTDISFESLKKAATITYLEKYDIKK